MRCVVSLHYTLEYSWLYNGKVLEKSDKYKIREAKFMRIRNVEKKDAGVYTCLVRNKFGISRRNYTLSVIGE